jgi:Ca-activated chloride channel family protein
MTSEPDVTVVQELRGRDVARDFGELLARAFALAIAVGLLLTVAATALPAPVETPEDSYSPEEATSGCFLVRRDGADPWAPAPILSTDVHYRVFGVVGRATVTQSFRNGADGFVEGVYVFPLPENVAVDHLRMRIGGRIVEGQIREREAARVEYHQATASGRRASLVEQQRPNIFTSRVANLAPGETLEVEIEFQQMLRFDEGEVSLRFPLVVGPRYIPGGPVASLDDGGGWAPDTDPVQGASWITPPVRPPSEDLHNPVKIEVDLDAGFPVDRIESRYHPVITLARGEQRFRVRLRSPRVPADRDFVLAWCPRDEAIPRSAVFEQDGHGARYVLLTLFPPTGPALERSRLPREIVYVVDTSGSMSGASIEQARRALLLALDRLRPDERFNVIQFNSTTQSVFPSSQPVAPGTLSLARSFVAGLVAQGGTEMRAALEAALVGSDDPRLVRQVVFLTDGSVGNEDDLFGVIRQRLGDTRLFTVGIGSAPNGHFMTKAAEFGHGTFTYIGDVRAVEERIGQLFARLESPVLTGLEVQWPEGVAVEAWPPRAPDLYLGEPVVLCARLSGPAEAVVVTGRRGREEWRESLPLDRRRAEGIGVLWARRKIDSLLDSLHEGASPDHVRAQVVALGLEHHLVTKHTSLVAVDVAPIRPEDAALERQAIATNLPRGWTYEGVFGQLPQTDGGAARASGGSPAVTLRAGGRRLGLAAALAVAGWNLGHAAWIEAKARLAQHLVRRAWSEQRAGAGDVRPWPWADTHPVARLLVPGEKGDLFVLAGASGRTMAFGPGHMDGTPLPGEPGNAVVSGHRDTHFAFLRRVHAGDPILVERRDGVRLRYVVRMVAVVDQRDTRVIEDFGDTRLTLVTCYPFDAIRPGGPLRYVVTARLDEGEPAPPRSRDRSPTPPPPSRLRGRRGATRSRTPACGGFPRRTRARLRSAEVLRHHRGVPRPDAERAPAARGGGSLRPPERRSGSSRARP